VRINEPLESDKQIPAFFGYAEISFLSPKTCGLNVDHRY
jgi:hypothetical protein